MLHCIGRNCLKSCRNGKGGKGKFNKIKFGDIWTARFPFTVANVPLEVKATGQMIPEWQIDETGLCGVLPEEDAVKGAKEEITLIPMGAARLRISAFPNTKE